MMSSAFPHSRSPGTKLSVVNSGLKVSALTFNVIRGRVLEYSSMKG